MATNLSVTPQASPLANKLTSADADETVCANATGASGLLYMVQIDNSVNALEVLYLKVYDALSPTIGTTAPEWVFKIKGGQKKVYAIPDGIEFDTGLSFAILTAAGTSGTTGPTVNVPVVFLTS